MSNENLKSINDELVEKYRPPTIDELKLPVRVMKLINANKDKIGYELLFFGTQGTGKTTTAELITKGHEVKYLSGSNEFTAAVMRNIVYPFIGNKSALGKQKTLIIDEFENIADKIQDAFKIIMDKAKNVNFIFITNEIGKVIPPLLSRLTKIEYNFSLEELTQQKINYLKFIVHVLTNEKFTYDEPGVGELIKQYFPDFRALLKALQVFKDTGVKHVDRAQVRLMSIVGVQDLELYEIIMKENDPKLFYERITNYNGKEKEAYLSLSEPFFRHLNNQQMFTQTLKAAEIVAKYSNIHVTTFNKFVSFLACAHELKSIFR